MDWSENNIARALATQVLKGRKLIMVPRCGWTGHECDLLVVDEKLFLIDVEIKISRSDFKADAKKDKWWRRYTYAESQKLGVSPYERTHRTDWPTKVCRHYYVMPEEIWDGKLLASLGSSKSGVILIRQSRSIVSCRVEKRSQRNPDAKPISAAAAIDIARLASYRLWEAQEKLNAMPQRRRIFGESR